MYCFYHRYTKQTIHLLVLPINGYTKTLNRKKEKSNWSISFV